MIYHPTKSFRSVNLSSAQHRHQVGPFIEYHLFQLSHKSFLHQKQILNISGLGFPSNMAIHVYGS